MNDLDEFSEAINRVGHIGFAINTVVKKFSLSMTDAIHAINKSFMNVEIKTLKCGAINDDIDLHVTYDALMLAKTHSDIISVLKMNEYPGTILKIFMELDIIEIRDTSGLAIKNKI